MSVEPVPALRALTARALGELAGALRSGRVTPDASSFMIRHIVAGIGEAAAIELSALLSTGLSPEHAALLVDTIAIERSSQPQWADIELVTSGPDMVGGSRDTGVMLRELFASAERRVLIVGFAVHQAARFSPSLPSVCDRFPN